MICTDIEDSSSLASLNTRLAIESAFGESSSILGIFSRLIPRSSEALKTFISPIQGFMDNKEEAGFKNSEYRETARKVSMLPFASYQDILIQVPEGFHGELVEYLKTLTQIHDTLISKANEVVLGYTDELAIFLNDVNRRKALTAHESFYLKIRSDREKAAKLLGAFFKTDSNLSRAKLGSVIKRFGEVDEIFSLAATLEACHRNTKLADLKNSVQQAVSLLDLIHERIQSDDSMDVSGAMAKHISEGAYETASFVELVSVSCYNTETALTCVRELAEQFKRITG